MIAVFEFLTEWQEYPHMDERWVEQAVWFRICPVFHTTATAEVTKIVF